MRGFTLPSKTVDSIGLIINEIATNVLKYGFNDVRDPFFPVDFQKKESEGNCIITLGSNGTPFPEDIDLENPETLGLRLISALVSQIEGTIELKRSPHPVFIIRFPVQ